MPPLPSRTSSFSWKARHEALSLPNFDHLELGVGLKQFPGPQEDFTIIATFNNTHALDVLVRYEIATVGDWNAKAR